MSIERLRDEIDELDRQLIELLGRRQQVTKEVGVYKQQIGKPIYDPLREQALIEKLKQQAQLQGVSEDLVEDVIRRIMRESYQSQHNAYSSALPTGSKVVVVGGSGALGSRFVDMFQRSGYQVEIIEKADWPIATRTLQDAKLVLISVPIEATINVIANLPILPEDCILADLTSLKAEPLRAMLDAHDGPVVGLHPMFGPDVPNFVKQVVVVCEGQQQQKCEWLLKQLTVWGAVLQPDDAVQHDKSMQLVQAMRHFSTFVYGKFLADQNPDLDRLLRLSSPIYRLELAMTGRLFAQDSELYADIIFGAEQGKQLAADYLTTLQEATALLATDNKTQFKAEFNAISQWFGVRSKQFLKESQSLLKAAQDSRNG